MGRFLPACPYLGTFPAGLEEPFARALVERLPGARVFRLEFGLACFTSTLDPRRVSEISIANNVFAVLAEARGGIHSLARALGTGAVRLRSDAFERYRSFYLVGWVYGTPVSPRELAGVERAIARRTGLVPRDRRRGIELSVMVRRDGHVYLLSRLTKPNADRARGQLSVALASLLCALGKPGSKDVFLDPFCGSGAIPLARLSSRCRLVHASDIEPEAVRKLRHVAARSCSSGRLVVQQADATRLPHADASISHLVTDPPWGLFRPVDDITGFYAALLREHVRVLRRRGLAVYLTAAATAFERALDGCSGFRVLRNYRVLVSGKKAVVFVLERR